VWSLALTIYETVTGKLLIPIEQTVLSLDSDPEVARETKTSANPIQLPPTASKRRRGHP
jgi:hypothetical protein